MSMQAPMLFAWTAVTHDGAAVRAMVPLRRFQRAADERFALGGVYPLIEEYEATTASRRHFFAVIREAWKTLPEPWDERFASAEHLRKYLLIRAGHRDERSIVCSSAAEAERIAAFARQLDDYAVVRVDGAVVVAYTAKSIRRGAIDRARFQEVKDRAFGVLAEILGVSPDALGRAA